MEGGDADVADVVLDAVAHRLDLDDVARDGDLEGLLVAAPDGYRQIGAHRPTHLVHRVVQRHSEDRFAVAVGDVVARLHAGTMGRGLLAWRATLVEALLNGHLDTNPA